MSAPPVILVYRALNLGDFLTGVPAYRAIARAFPYHRKLLAAPAVLSPLARATGAFDGIIDTKSELLEALPMLGDIDVAVDLHGRGPECHRVVLAAKPKRFIAFRNAGIPRSEHGPEWRADEHEVHRWCRMLEAYGIATDPDDIRLPHPIGIGEWKGVSILHPGAASVSRRWPIERWIAVARHLREQGERVVVTGNANEYSIARAVADGADLPNANMLAGKTSLATLSSIVAHARRVVSGDTGVSHLAFAFATPSLTLYGPISPEYWGPPNRPQHRTMWRGQNGDPHGTILDRGLEQIQVRDVIDALDS